MLAIGKEERTAFTLIEVLVAMGILFVVGSAVIALTNSLARGAIASSDRTIANRWASEGLELATKIRDDNWKSHQADWFKPAIKDNGVDYGWYKLDSGTLTNLALTRLVKNDVLRLGENLQSDNLKAGRLICIESFNAVDQADSQAFYCNTDSNLTKIQDGSRNVPANGCGTNSSLYCHVTYNSLNRDSGVQKVILPGNALKIRSVVIWQDRGQYQESSISTLLTNWREQGQ